MKFGAKEVVIEDEPRPQRSNGHTHLKKNGHRKRKHRGPARLCKCRICGQGFAWSDTGVEGGHYEFILKSHNPNYMNSSGTPTQSAESDYAYCVYGLRNYRTPQWLLISGHFPKLAKNLQTCTSPRRHTRDTTWESQRPNLANMKKWHMPKSERTTEGAGQDCTQNQRNYSL